MPMEGDEGRAQTQSSPSGMGAGRVAERGDTTGYQGQGRGSGVTSDRPSPGGGNTGGGGGGGADRDRQGGPSKEQTTFGGGGGNKDSKAVKEAADRAAKEAVDRAAAETAAREFQKRQMAEAEKARIDSLARQELAKNIGIPSLMTNTFSTTPMSMPSGLAPTIPSGMMADQKNLFDFGYTDPTSTAMRMQGDVERNLSNLGTLDPSFQSKVAGTLDEVMNAGLNPYLVSTARTFTPAKQPGGPTPAEDSYHKYGLAVDVGLTGEKPEDYKLMGDIGAGRDLGWGGSFSSNYDPMHLQAGPVGIGATEYATEMDIPKVSVSGRPFLPSGSPSAGDQIASLGGTIKKTLDDAFNSITPKDVASTAIQVGAYAVNPLYGLANTVSGYLGGPTLQDTFLGGSPSQQEFNRDRQMTQEEVNIAEFNRLYPNAGSDRERYGGRDQVLPTAPITPSIPKTPVIPPVVPTEPVMPTVPNFAAAQQYIGTPTVATPGFNFSMPFAPRPQVDFANLGQAYAPTALPSAPPTQPLPGIPGAAYATPYQRLG